ncbi:hypothetical protein KCP70_13700 [Salmonella enterica subsp. enterica]|nr:hypothetical protein KCP70_13700 [Salmonella enterica subsp. enterica]
MPCVGRRVADAGAAPHAVSSRAGARYAGAGRFAAHSPSLPALKSYPFLNKPNRRYYSYPPGFPARRWRWIVICYAVATPHSTQRAAASCMASPRRAGNFRRGVLFRRTCQILRQMRGKARRRADSELVVLVLASGWD